MSNTDFQIDVQAMYNEALNQAAAESGVEKDAEKAAPKAPKPRGRPKVEKPAPKEPRVAPVAVAPAPVPKPSAAKVKSSSIKTHKGEDPKERARLVRHILKYRALLDGKDSPDVDTKSLKSPTASMSVDELRILKEEYRLARSMGGARERLGGIYMAGVSAVEVAAANMDPFNSLRGLTAAVEENSDVIDPLLDEIAIEMDEYLTVDPKMALVLTTAQIAGLVAAKNARESEGKQEQ